MNAPKIQTPGQRLKPVKVEGFVVPLLRLGDGRTAFVDKYGGPRKVWKFSDEKKAREEAVIMANRVLRGGTVRHGLRQSDVDAYARAVEVCARFQTPVTVALD